MQSLVFGQMVLVFECFRTILTFVWTLTCAIPEQQKRNEEEREIEILVNSCSGRSCVHANFTLSQNVDNKLLTVNYRSINFPSIYNLHAKLSDK